MSVVAIVAVSYHFMKHDINNLYLEKHDERLMSPAVGHAIFWVCLIITFDLFLQILISESIRWPQQRVLYIKVILHEFHDGSL